MSQYTNMLKLSQHECPRIQNVHTTFLKPWWNRKQHAEASEMEIIQHQGNVSIPFRTDVMNNLHEFHFKKGDVYWLIR